VALVGAGLFLRSLGNARKFDPGFDAAHLSTLSFSLSARGLAGDAADLRQREILERVRGVPGVERAAVANAVPLSAGGFARSVFLEGQDTTDARAGRFVQIAVVGDDYFEATAIPVVRGRAFKPTDRPGAPSVVVINQTMAERFWPGEDAIGKRFKFFSATEFTEVVGIAQNSKYNFLGEEAGPYMYQPLSQQPQPAVSLLVRSARPESTLGAVRALVQSMEPQVPLTNVSTMETVLGQSLFLPRMGALLLAIFGGLALTLAAIGMYGVMAYVVGQRTREIGIRMALGASAGTVRQLVLRQGLTLTGIGLALGLALAAVAVRPLSALLFDVSAFDPVTFAVIPLLLAAVATMAILVPARRASRVNATDALKAT
jgi:predicted permease